MSHLDQTLYNTPEDSTPEEIVQPSSKPINPLALSSTAAALVKAHTTKLALLALNKPFTPSSISQILSSISTSPLPALLTAVQICDPTKLSKFGKRQLRRKVGSLFSNYESLLAEIPRDEEQQASKFLAAKEAPTWNDGTDPAIMNTGLVWNSCDEIIEFAEQGLSATIAKYVASDQDLFEDALGELHSRLQKADENGNIENRLDNLQLGESDSDFESIESFSAGPTKEMTPVIKWALEIFDLIFLLFAPLIEQRINRFPVINSKTISETSDENIDRLDKLYEAARYWSAQIDKIAYNLYRNDIEATVTYIDQFTLSAEAGAQDIKLNWNGSEDEVSAWIVQWSKKFADAKTIGRPNILQPVCDDPPSVMSGQELAQLGPDLTSE